MIFFDCKAQLFYSHLERLPLHCIFNEYIVQKLKANNIKKLAATTTVVASLQKDLQNTWV